MHAYQFYPAVMYSHARFTYTEVAAILANTRGPEASKRKDRVKDLLNLHDVYRALQVARQQRGAVDFETTETQIVCDEKRPYREDRAPHAQRCAQADRRGDAGGQRLQRGLH